MKKWGVIFILLTAISICYSFSRYKLTPFTIPVPTYINSRIGSMNFPDKENPLTIEGIALGRQLFYDKNLSASKTISCGSCHIQAFAFTDTARFSKGFENDIGDKNSMSLVNLGWNNKFFWDGRAGNLQDQIHDPIIDKREMANTWAEVLTYINQQSHYKKAFQQIFKSKRIGDTEVKKAIEQFVASIISFNTPFDQYYYLDNNNAINDTAKQGLKLFFGKAKCGNCHNGVLLTNQQFLNNGLDSLPHTGHYNASLKNTDKGLFKTPTLRNIALTAPYMHDGRFENLEAVLNFYNSKVNKHSPNLDFRMEPFIKGLALTPVEIKQLIVFLHTLTDSSLLINAAYADPY